MEPARMAPRRVCVFCGSRSGRHPAYAADAEALGAALATRGLGVVYGGASVGLMGCVADAALRLGGEVIGVIPRGLASREVAHSGLTTLLMVETMHERKAKMQELSGGFIALPGGFGTLEELFEITTWLQLGLHEKPIGLLNTRGFFDPMLAQLSKAIGEGFIPEELAAAIVVDTRAEALVERALAHRVPAPTVRWLTPRET